MNQDANVSCWSAARTALFVFAGIALAVFLANTSPQQPVGEIVGVVAE